MSTKTLLLDGVTGSITPGVGTNTFTITDPSFFKCVKIEGLAAADTINLVRENYAGDGWEPATDGQGVVQLNTRRSSATPAEIGTYALEGDVAGTITAYTEE